MNNNKFSQKIVGAVSILVKNSNHNSDFEGPRKNGDKLIATDKVVKYYIRGVLDASGEKVFYRKSLDGESKPKKIDDRINDLEIKNKRDFFNCMDVKFFGGVIQPKGGDKSKLPTLNTDSPLTIQWGCNISGNENYDTQNILSQFSQGDKEDGSKKDQTTSGTITFIEDANYVHYFSFLPKKLERNILMQTNEFKNDVPYFTKEEVDKVKYAIKNCVGSTVDGSYISSSKSNTKVGLTVFITFKEDFNYNFEINETIKIKENSNNYDLSLLFEKTEDYKQYIDTVEISYPKGLVSFEQDLDQDFLKNDMYIISDKG